MPTATFSCPECSTVLRLVNRPQAGKKIRCPKCNAVFPVPAEDDLASAVRADDRPAGAARKAKRLDGNGHVATKPPRKAAVRDEDDDDDESPRPRRKLKKSEAGSKGLLIGLVCGLLVLLIGGGAIGAFVWPGFLKSKEEGGSAKGEDKNKGGNSGAPVESAEAAANKGTGDEVALAYVPTDYYMVAGLKPAVLEEVKLLGLLELFLKRDAVEKFQSETGLSLRDVEAVYVARRLKLEDKGGPAPQNPEQPKRPDRGLEPLPGPGVGISPDQPKRPGRGLEPVPGPGGGDKPKLPDRNQFQKIQPDDKPKTLDPKLFPGNQVPPEPKNPPIDFGGAGVPKASGNSKDIFVVKTLKPFDQVKVAKALKGSAKKYQDKVFFEISGAGEDMKTLFMPNDTLAVLSNLPPDEFKAVVGFEGKKPQLRADVEKLIQGVEKNPAWLVMGIDDEVRKAIREEKATSPEDQLLKQFFANDADALDLAFQVDQKSVAVKLVAHCKDSSKASSSVRDLSAMVEGWKREAVRGWSASFAKNMPTSVNRAVTEVVGGLAVKSQGADVEMSTHLSRNSLEVAVRDLQQLFEGKKPPIGGGITIPTDPVPGGGVAEANKGTGDEQPLAYVPADYPVVFGLKPAALAELNLLESPEKKLTEGSAFFANLKKEANLSLKDFELVVAGVKVDMDAKKGGGNPLPPQTDPGKDPRLPAEPTRPTPDKPDRPLSQKVRPGGPPRIDPRQPNPGIDPRQPNPNPTPVQPPQAGSVGEKMVMALKAKAPFDQLQVARAVKGAARKHAGKTFYALSGEDGIKTLYMPNDTLLVLSTLPAEEFQAVVALDGKDVKLPAETKQMVQNVNQSAGWAVVGHDEKLMATAKAAAVLFAPYAGIVAGLAEGKGLEVSLNGDQKAVTVRALLYCGDQITANRAGQLLTQGLNQLKAQMQNSLRDPNTSALAKQVIGEVMNKGLGVAPKPGFKFEGTLTLSRPTAEALFKDIDKFVPGGGAVLPHNPGGKPPSGQTPPGSKID